MKPPLDPLYHSVALFWPPFAFDLDGGFAVRPSQFISLSDDLDLSCYFVVFYPIIRGFDLLNKDFVTHAIVILVFV